MILHTYILEYKYYLRSTLFLIFLKIFDSARAIVQKPPISAVSLDFRDSWHKDRQDSPARFLKFFAVSLKPCRTLPHDRARL